VLPGRGPNPKIGEEQYSLADSMRTPPALLRKELSKLGAALDAVIPAKRRSNLIIGTWNIRAFDRVVPKWRSVRGDTPIRDLSNLACIAEVIRRFDVVAIQEVRQSAEAFLAMMEALGEGWAYLVTDVTQGKEGNNERLAFVFDRRRVQLAGLACELVVAAEDATSMSEEVLKKQFARTPYAVSFARGSSQFTLVTLHVTYGKRAIERVPELEEIAVWLAGWAKKGDQWGTNLIALGDFNIDRQADPLYQAFTSTGLQPPDPLNYVPRTVFDDPDPTEAPNHRHFYDQIAWFTSGAGIPLLTFDYANAGMFNFDAGIIPAEDRTQLSWRISDHFPLWAEFRLPS